MHGELRDGLGRLLPKLHAAVEKHNLCANSAHSAALRENFFAPGKVVVSSEQSSGLRGGECEVIVAEVLAAWWQLVVDQRRQHLFQLQEEPFARFVAIREHVERQP